MDLQLIWRQRCWRKRESPSQVTSTKLAWCSTRCWWASHLIIMTTLKFCTRTLKRESLRSPSIFQARPRSASSKCSIATQQRDQVWSSFRKTPSSLLSTGKSSSACSLTLQWYSRDQLSPSLPPASLTKSKCYSKRISTLPRQLAQKTSNVEAAKR